MTKRTLTGTIVSDKMDKTRVVDVVTMKKHSRYQKFYRSTTRLKAHDENNEFKMGDKVVVEETNPISKDKRWKIVSKV